MNGNLTPKEAKDKIEGGDVNIIDVRTPAEYSNGHIKGSRNLDISNPTFMEEIMKLDNEKNYLVYCQSGGRSGSAQKMMTGLGFKNVCNLAGGIAVWGRDGFPVEK